MKPPKVTPDWIVGGWLVESGHVPGSYRMLGIWAASFAAGFGVSLTGHLYLAAFLGCLGLIGGAAFYLRMDRGFLPVKPGQARPTSTPPASRPLVAPKPALRLVPVTDEYDQDVEVAR